MASGERPCARQFVAQHLPSAIVKRSVIIAGRKTSVSVEDAFWGVLKDIARSRCMTLSDMVAHIDGHRSHSNLSSALRLFVLEHARTQCALTAVPGSDGRAAANFC